MTVQGLFISGTDTGVGKTQITCWLARLLAERGVRVGACKPVASGAEEREGRLVWGDTESLLASISVPASEDLVTPIRLRAPLAPNVAARREGRPLPLGDYRSAIEAWTGRCDVLLVEGVGGLLCPITDDATVADLAQWWGRPVLIVARLGLGTINHTLLTLEAARTRGLAVVGVVINQAERTTGTIAEETNPAELRRLVEVPVWGPIGHQARDEGIPPELRELAELLFVESRPPRE